MECLYIVDAHQVGISIFIIIVLTLSSVKTIRQIKGPYALETTVRERYGIENGSLTSKWHLR